MTRHIMIDLETMGTGPRSAIAAIGAVEFELCGMGLGATLYRRVNLRSAMEAGLVLDADTVLWWLGQSDAARAELTSPDNVTLQHALYDLAKMIAGPDGDDCSTIVWANGTSFDFSILAEAYRAVKFQQPWKYWNERDYRTVRKIGPPVECERTGTHHNALDDACHQALHLQRVMRRLHQIDLAEAA